jgi:hypothetical protein
MIAVGLMLSAGEKVPQTFVASNTRDRNHRIPPSSMRPRWSKTRGIELRFTLISSPASDMQSGGGCLQLKVG